MSSRCDRHGVGRAVAASFGSGRSDLDLPTNYDFATGDPTGWSTNGNVSIGTSGGPEGAYGIIPNTAGAFLTTAAFTVSAEADASVFDFGLNGTFVDIYVLSGATYATATKLDTLICNGCTWLEGSLSASAWHGQSIKLKFLRSSGSIAIDRVRTVNLAAGGWEFTGGAPSLTSFSGNPTLSGLIGLTTPADTIDASAEYLTFTAINAQPWKCVH